MTATTSRFRLYGSGGRPVYDSAGDPGDERLDRIKREFNAGVAAFYRPAEGLVRTQVKIHRRSPEQFVATYQTAGDEDPLERVVERVASLADSRGWTIQRGLGGTQALYDAVADGSAFDGDAIAAVERDLADRSLDADTLRSVMAETGSVDLLVPDYATAAVALGFARETLAGAAVAVTESTDVETVAEAEVVIRPDGGVDRVAPGPELSAWLDRRRVTAAERSLSEAFATVAERAESGSGSNPGSAAVVAAVNRTEATADLGVRAVPASTPDTARGELRRTAAYGVPTGLLVGVAAGAAWAVGVAGLPRWLLAACGVLAVAAWAVGLAAVRLRGGGDPGAVGTDAGVDSGAVAAVDDALRRVGAAGDAGAARESLDAALDSYGAATEAVDDAERRRRRAVGAGVAVSVGICAVGFAVAALLPAFL
jgi:hypothetical protein